MTPAPRWKRPLLVAHLAATVSLLGTALVLVALGVSGLRGADPRTVYPATSVVESWLVVPLAIIALATGLLQALLTGLGLIRYWWTAVKLAITTALTVLVTMVLAPGLAAAAHAATSGPAGAVSDAQRLRIALFPAVACALLLLNIGLGVYKPGWRLWSRDRTAAKARRAKA